MKKLILLILILLCFNSEAQNYSFGLVQNNGYSFSVVAVPDFDSGTFDPIVQLYGFTLVLPAGTMATVDNIQPAGLTLIGGSYTVVPGSTPSIVGVDPSMSDKDLLVFATDASTGIPIPAHSVGQQIPLITFTISGDPTTGVLTLLDNNSLVATAFTAFESYFTADATDDSIDSTSDLYSGQTGMTSFDFSTLNVFENKLLEIAIYPNPVIDSIKIYGNVSEIEVIEIYSLSGKLIKVITNGFDNINVTDLQSSIYFLKVSTDSSNKTIKFIKE